MTDPTPSLADLRAEIDRLDAAMHGLLMQRGAVIEQLIAVKRSADSGSAFRPGREVAVMRALIERHRGILPIDTVEGIWRVIISTFTYVQAPHAVHVDITGGEPLMRDSARFHFGFTVPYVPHEGAGATIAAVADSRGDLGLIRADLGARSGAWWDQLCLPDSPRIIARLPFVDRPTHPAGTPVYVVARPILEAQARERVVYAARTERWRASAAETLTACGAAVVATAGTARGLSILIDAPATVDGPQLDAALTAADLGVIALTEIGCHADSVRLTPD